jgi:uncharacterized protein with GYD domain
MSFYLYQWVYKDPAIAAMIKMPQDRPAELRKAVEGFGGKVHQFFYAFGPFDGVAITEFPDNESAVACGLTLGGAGGNTSLTTTVLITPEEGQKAMARARLVNTGYTAPIGYSSYG